VVDPEYAGAESRNSTVIANSVGALAEAIDAYEELAFDDLIVGLRPPTKRSLERLATALQNRAT